MADQVLASVIRKNNEEYEAPRRQSIPCGTGTVAESIYWRTPVVDDLGSIRFEYKIAAAKPSLDSNKVLRVRDNNTQNIYWVLIGDAGTASAYIDKCAVCCGEDSDMDAPTYVAPVVETKTCKDDDGKYNHFTFTEAVPANHHYHIAASVNGVFLTPAFTAVNITTLAALKTWLNTNWAGGGAHAWDYTGTKVTLASTTAATASISITIVAD